MSNDFRITAENIEAAKATDLSKAFAAHLAKKAAQLKETVIRSLIPEGVSPEDWAKEHRVYFSSSPNDYRFEQLWVDGQLIGTFELGFSDSDPSGGVHLVYSWKPERRRG